MPSQMRCPNPDCQAVVDGSEGCCPNCGRTFTVAQPPRTPARSRLPAKIGRYEVRALLGQGAFGSVYRAFDPKLKREVALKVLKAEMTASPQAVKRFLREAQAAANLDHSNIVPVFDADRAGDHYYFTSAFIKGRSLASAIPEEGVEPRRAAEWTAQLASALDYAHKQGLIHRDVKPANAMLNEEEVLKLMDFGLAGWTQEAGSRLTKAGAVMGTPAYMAPEQVNGDTAAVGPRSDLYSAGVVLYELLTGQTPFEGCPMVVLPHQIMNVTPPPPSQHRPDLDAKLVAICLKAMAKKPAERYQTGAELAAALRAWTPTALPLAEPMAPPKAAEPPLSVWNKKTVLPPSVRRGASTTRQEPPREPVRRPPVPPKGGLFTLLGAAVAVLLVMVACTGVAFLIFLSPAPASTAPSAVLPRPTTGPIMDTRPPAGAPSLLDCTGEKGASAAEVRRSQEAWAKYLGRQVEEEDEIAPGVKMKFALVPPGKFLMGSPEGETGRSKDEVQHDVELTYPKHPIYLGVYDVTRGQFRRFVEDARYQTEAEVQNEKTMWRDPGFAQTDEDPVVEVTWNDAAKYVEWMNKNAKGGLLYRLPTEAEWEYSSRGGCPSSNPFGIGDGTSLSSTQANFNGKYPYGGAKEGPDLEKTTPGGTYPANALGLYDMQGNVWQWCADWYGDYPTSRVVDPLGPDSGSSRVSRGGGWIDFAWYCRAAYRSRDAPVYRTFNLGFRLARVLPSGQAK